MTTPLVHIGRHLIREEGDVVFVEWNGDVGLEDVRELVEVIERAHAAHPVLFMLSDGRRSGDFDVEARRFVIEQAQQRNLVAVSVVFGASFPGRIIANMLHRAMKLLVPGSPEIVFFSSEADARAFIDAERRRRHAV